MLWASFKEKGEIEEEGRGMWSKGHSDQKELIRSFDNVIKCLRDFLVTLYPSWMFISKRFGSVTLHEVTLRLSVAFPFHHKHVRGK